MIETVALDQLVLYPGNPRVGNVDALMESLAVNGPYQPVIVQRSTRHVLAGNHTVKAARNLGWDSLPVRWLDVDDDQARRIVLADNGTSDLASYDDAALLALLDDLDGDLAGTGWDDDSLDALRELVETPLDLTLPDDGAATAERRSSREDTEPAGPSIDVARLDRPIVLTDGEAARIVDVIEASAGKPEAVIRARLGLPARREAARARRVGPAPQHEPAQHRVPIDSIEPHPENAREGDIGAIAASLAEFGQYRPVVVQLSTRWILAGTHRWLAMRTLGWEEVDVVFVDVDEADARRILLVDNRTSDLGRLDDEAFAAILSGLASFAGTPYGFDDLDGALSRIDSNQPARKARIRVKVPDRKVNWKVDESWRRYDPWWAELFDACGHDMNAVRSEIVARLS